MTDILKMSLPTKARGFPAVDYRENKSQPLRKVRCRLVKKASKRTES